MVRVVRYGEVMIGGAGGGVGGAALYRIHGSEGVGVSITPVPKFLAPSS